MVYFWVDKYRKADAEHFNYLMYDMKMIPDDEYLDVLKEKEELTLNQCCRLCKASRPSMCNLLADFIRFGLVTPLFKEHKFYFKFNEE